MKKLIAVMFVLYGVLLSLYVKADTESIHRSILEEGSLVGMLAPDFSIVRMNGEAFSLSQYRGKKAVHLVFWSTWCPVCQSEIPTIKASYARYHNDIAVLAINVAVNDSMKKVSRYQEKYSLSYPLYFDAHQAVSQAYDIIGVPTQIIIDINGIIRYRDARYPKALSQHLPSLIKR